MKDLSNKYSNGFSVLEVIIALALLMTVVVGALEAQFMFEYWALSAESASAAIALAVDEIGQVRVDSITDFFAVTTKPTEKIIGSDNPWAETCQSGGTCYWRFVYVKDISPCAKSITAAIGRRINSRYATSTVSFTSDAFNETEVVNRGGDCLLAPLSSWWASTTPLKTATLVGLPTGMTGIDTLTNRIYVVASLAPQFRVYNRPDNPTLVPELLSTSTVTGNRLNAIDVIRDIPSGRTYAYVVQHTVTDQLLVLDVTGDEIDLVATRPLTAADPLGSFPQGWRVAAYGGRLYVLSRETAGAELHIFSIADPSDPVPISTGSMNLARTVNDFFVREQLVEGILKRYLFLASSADLKELAVIEVTNDIPIERHAYNLPGTQNALALVVHGGTLYLGRQQISSGPELSQYRLAALLTGDGIPQAQSEVGADVHTLQASGPLLIVGTNRANAELQVWQQDGTTWSDTLPNAARLTAASLPRLAPKGIEVSSDYLYTITQSAVQPEQLSVWSLP